MSSLLRNDIICNSSPDIMEYLIQKLESRQRNLSNYANFFNSINSFESFYQKKHDIFNLFRNLEEELHQAALAIKALLVQNKSLALESIGNKGIQRNYNKLIQENNYLLLENNNFAKKLKELKNISRSPKSAKNSNFSGISKTRMKYNNTNKNISRDYPIKNNYKSNYDNKNINNKKYKGKPNNKNTNNNINNDIDLNDIGQLKNVKNIIKDMKDNKTKLRAVIEEHFGGKDFQGNGNQFNFKNI